LNVSIIPKKLTDVQLPISSAAWKFSNVTLPDWGAYLMEVVHELQLIEKLQPKENTKSSYLFAC